MNAPYCKDVQGIKDSSGSNEYGINERRKHESGGSSLFSNENRDRVSEIDKRGRSNFLRDLLSRNVETDLANRYSIYGTPGKKCIFLRKSRDIVAIG